MQDVRAGSRAVVEAGAGDGHLVAALVVHVGQADFGKGLQPIGLRELVHAGNRAGVSGGQHRVAGAVVPCIRRFRRILDVGALGHHQGDRVTSVQALITLTALSGVGAHVRHEHLDGDVLLILGEVVAGADHWVDGGVHPAAVTRLDVHWLGNNEVNVASADVIRLSEVVLNVQHDGAANCQHVRFIGRNVSGRVQRLDHQLEFHGGAGRRGTGRDCGRSGRRRRRPRRVFVVGIVGVEASRAVVPVASREIRGGHRGCITLVSLRRLRLHSGECHHHGQHPEHGQRHQGHRPDALSRFVTHLTKSPLRLSSCAVPGWRDDGNRLLSPGVSSWRMVTSTQRLSSSGIRGRTLRG